MAAAPTPGDCVPISGLWGLKPLVVFASLQLWVQVGMAPLHVLMTMVGLPPLLSRGSPLGDQATGPPLVPELPLSTSVILEGALREGTESPKKTPEDKVRRG